MILTRPDIVGRWILRVLQTPWHRTESDGFTVDTCSVFVLLDQGVLFPLQPSFDAEGNLPPIEAASADVRLLVPADFHRARTPNSVPSCEGETVLEVLASDSHPYIALLLSSRRLLTVDCPLGFDYSAVGPALDSQELGEHHPWVTYWERRPVTGSVGGGES